MVCGVEGRSLYTSLGGFGGQKGTPFLKVGVSLWNIAPGAVPREVSQAPEEPGRGHTPLLAAHGL